MANIVENQENTSVENLWNTMKTKLIELRNKFVPIKTTSGKPFWKDRGSIPISKPLREAIHNKHIAHRRWMSRRDRSDSDDAHSSYNKARNKVKTMMRKAKREFERGIANQCKRNPKPFWAHVRSKLKTKTGVAPLRENNQDKDSMRFDDKQKADILQNQFSSVFTREPNGEIPSFNRRTNAKLLRIAVTKDMVRKEILKLNINKSCGPDEIHARLLIALVDYISEPIALLLNKTFEAGEIPLDWKKARVSPIFKKGSRHTAENYRPISLTSIVCKLMESFIKDAIMDHIKTYNLLSSKQYGFISGRSTTTQLLNYLDICIDTIVTGGVVDTIYFDFAKAFDTVPHRRLLKKLEAYGIDGMNLKWIEAFLSDRTQVVCVNGEYSEVTSVLSGIPQGSVLGPILFVLYINDLPESVKSDIYLFADDTKIMKHIVTKDDATSLQLDINAMQQWSKKWLLQFHPEKCHVLTLGKFENITHTQNYKLNEQILEHVFDEKDLGVRIDSNLTFDDHISEKVKKANSIVGLIRRSFSYLDCALFKTLFTTFVRPHLEYAQAVWSPHLQKHINTLENVQIRATKLVDGLHDLTYTERLEKIGLPTLAYRRMRGDLIEVYKHFRTYDRETMPHSFQPRTRTTRTHNFQLVVKRAMDGDRGLQTNSFYQRATKLWNNLPQTVVNAENINIFKNRLDDAMNNHPIKLNHIMSDSQRLL